MGWLSITAGKSRVMSPRLNSSFISLHAQVSSSLSVLIVSIPKFDCRSLGLLQPSYSLIKYSTSRERKLHLQNFTFNSPLCGLVVFLFFFGISTCCYRLQRSHFSSCASRWVVLNCTCSPNLKKDL